MLLSCGSAIPGQPAGDCQRSSLHVGPLWFFSSQYLGYVRVGVLAGGSRPRPASPGAGTVTQVAVEVAAGAAFCQLQRQCWRGHQGQGGQLTSARRERRMDEISEEPRHDFRLPPGPRRWLTVAGVAS
jgi:hypothetical protein